MSSTSKYSKKTYQKGSSKRSPPKPVSLGEFKIKNHSVQDFDFENELSKYQYIAYPRYQRTKDGNPDQMILMTDMIKFTQHGLPKKPDEDEEDNSDYMRIPFDTNQPECMALQQVMESVDKYALENKEELLTSVWDNVYKKNYEKIYKKKHKKDPGSSELKKKFKSWLDSVEYQPVVRHPRVSDDDDEDDVRYGNMKVKFDRDYNKDGRPFSTLFFVKKDDADKSTPLAKQYEKVNPRNMTELRKYFGYQSESKLILMVNKFYLSKGAGLGTKDPNAKHTYGYTVKVSQMAMEPRASMGSENLASRVKNQFSFGDGGDDGDDGDGSAEDELVVEVASDDEEEVVETKKAKVASDDDDEDLGDEDEEVVETKKTKSSKKAKVEEASDDEDEDLGDEDEDEEDDNEDEDEDEDELEDDEESEEEEEVKPKKKTKKSSKSKSKNA